MSKVGEIARNERDARRHTLASYRPACCLLIDAATAEQAQGAGCSTLLMKHPIKSCPRKAARLLEIGTDPFTFSDALVAILAQRLRASCAIHCRDIHIEKAAPLTIDGNRP